MKHGRESTDMFFLNLKAYCATELLIFRRCRDCWNVAVSTVLYIMHTSTYIAYSSYTYIMYIAHTSLRFDMTVGCVINFLCSQRQFNCAQCAPLMLAPGHFYPSPIGWINCPTLERNVSLGGRSSVRLVSATCCCCRNATILRCLIRGATHTHMDLHGEARFRRNENSQACPGCWTHPTEC